MIVWFFFFKQKTAYEMRISDWSSDVCSSDLDGFDRHRAGIDIDSGGSPSSLQCIEGVLRVHLLHGIRLQRIFRSAGHRWAGAKIGRASGRERVCKFV